MRKVLTVVTLFALLVIGTVGVQATEITMWAMNNAPSEQNIAWFNEKAAEFEAQTGHKVIFEEIGWSEVMTKITTALTTGEGANVMQVGTTQTPFFAATGGLVQFDINEFGGKNVFMEANLKSTEYNGNYFGVPWIAETRVLFYNTEMFEKAGVLPPRTWEELIEVGEEITKVYGEGTAIAIAGTTAWDLIHNWAPVLWTYGGDFLNEDQTEVIFNSESGVQAMEYYLSLIQKGLASTACAEYDQSQADAAFANGDVAMAIQGPWNMAGIRNDNPDLPYAAAELPLGPGGKAAYAGGSNLIIRANASQKEIAVAREWVKFLTNEENMKSYTKISDMLPAKKGAFNDPYYNAHVWRVFEKSLDYAVAYPSIVAWGQLEGILKSNIMNILTDYVSGNYDDETIEYYLDAAAEEVESILN